MYKCMFGICIAMALTDKAQQPPEPKGRTSAEDAVADAAVIIDGTPMMIGSGESWPTRARQAGRKKARTGSNTARRLSSRTKVQLT